MSIVAFTGLPGSGKSYSAVETVVIPAIEKGRTIVTNIPLMLGRISDDYPEAKIIKFESDCNNEFFTATNFYPGAVYVIDEAWRWWSSGTKANTIPDDQKQFFTEHRHFVGDDGYTTEIVLVTQDLNQVASFVKNLVQETYRCSKLSSLGQSNKYRCDVYSGLAEGQKPRGEPVRQFYGKYSESVYQFYKSHSQNKTGYSTGNEDKQGKSSNILKSPKFVIIILAGPLLAFFAIWHAFSLFQGDTEQPENSSDSIDPVGPVESGSVRSVNSSSEPSDQTLYDLDFFERPDPLPVPETEVLHPESKIVGFIRTPAGPEYLVHLPNGETKSFARELCGYLASGDPVCVYEGLAVTWHSGFEIPDGTVTSDSSSGMASAGSTDDSDSSFAF